MLDELLAPYYEKSVYDVKQRDKERLILHSLKYLNQHHYEHCVEYKNLVNAMSFELDSESYQKQPFVAARLFKMLPLKSIDNNTVVKQLTSSGTSSQTVSRIFLDAQTSKHQSKVLAKILQEFIGRQRLPMLLIESPDIIKDRQAFSARGAGIQGLSFIGRDHTYALNSDMSLNSEVINIFKESHRNDKVILFGFTFMVWKHLLQALDERNECLNFDNAVLFHSGGWKKLQSQTVDNDTFKQMCQEKIGHIAVHNFYGMVEQTGTIYMECEEGHLHASVFSDIIIRDPENHEIMPEGKEGLIQLLSVLPYSYPGHSILTEDMGRILGTDNCPCGRKGRYFEVFGRLSKSETRGCSDTYQ